MVESVVVLGILCWGFCAGAWWAERGHRRDKASQEKGRICISMPAKPEDAAKMLALLSYFMNQIEKDMRQIEKEHGGPR
jgi:hypothetical protein